MAKSLDDLDETYRRCAPAVFRRARRLLANDADAQDVVHDVFLDLFRRPEQYGERGSLTAFLYSMTTHACLARIRDSRNRLRLLALHAHAEQASPEQIAAVQLHEALRKMPELLARVAIYAYVDQLSRDEIAALVPCSRRHVTNLLQRIAEWGRQEEASCS